jgi:hypothetical protein
MKAKLNAHKPARRDRLIHEHIHDPYKVRRKLPEPSVCPVCFAVFKQGRWQWADSWPLDSHREICQACHRIRDNYPAGVVTLTGNFVRTHKDEILGLARNHEAQEKQEHPLHRIMAVEEPPGALVIKATDIHLPRRIADALHHAYKGELDLHYEEENYFIRVNWKRES